MNLKDFYTLKKEYEEARDNHYDALDKAIERVANGDRISRSELKKLNVMKLSAESAKRDYESCFITECMVASLEG